MVSVLIWFLKSCSKQVRYFNFDSDLKIWISCCREWSFVNMESSEDGAAKMEPPDPDVLETDPTCRYIRVMLCSFLYC